MTPLTGTRASLTSQAFGEFIKLGHNSPYWIGLLTNSLDTNAAGRAFAFDSFGNIYTVGQIGYSSVSLYYASLNKYSPMGNLIWQVALSDTVSQNDIIYGIAIDSSNNIYICGAGTSPLSSYQTPFFAKFNTSGSLQWTKSYRGSTTTTAAYAYDIAVDSSGYFYVVGNSLQTSSKSTITLSKWDSSGTLQWSNCLFDTVGSSYLDTGEGISIDSSGNIYIVGYAYSSTTSIIGILAKYNSSGVLQWQVQLSDAYATTQTIHYGVKADSSGNVYVVGKGRNSSAASTLSLSKYNSSGTYISGAQILDAGSSHGTLGYGVDVDSSGNVYVSGYGTTSTNSLTAFIAKYNSSLTLQWQRTLQDTNSSPVTYGYRLKIDSSNNLFFVGRCYNNSSGLSQFIAKLPSDGSLTGTYSGVTFGMNYTASSWTSTSSSWTSATATLNNAPASITSSSESWTANAGTATADYVSV